MSSSLDIGRRNAIPVIYTSGTHYEVGFDVGRTFRDLIQKYVGSSKEVHAVLLPTYETKNGRAAYDITLASLKENYPHYIRELEGTADGAQVPFHHLMVLHMDMIMRKMAGVGWEAASDTPTGCSALSINRDGNVLLGHTEDALEELLNNVYLVSAQIHEDPQGKSGARDESFTAFCYAGHLPGFCMGYNRHGLVFSINALSPRVVLAGKTPRHFLCRALLSATTMAEAHRIIRDKGIGAADGFAVNMIFMQEDGDHIFQNAEVGPTEDSDESALSVVTLNVGEHLLHTNKYLRLNINQMGSIHTKSSDHRHARADQFPAPTNRRDLLALLSDTDDPLFPFFREGSTEDKGKTLALGVFDLIKKTWAIWMKNPKNADPLLEIPLSFTWNT